MPERVDADQPPQPSHIPETTATNYGKVVNDAWLIECMMSVQGTLGELKANVSSLKTNAEKNTAKLERISHILFAAGIVLTLLLAVAGFTLNKVWDGLMLLLIRGH